MDRPIRCSVEATFRSTNTETIPFQNKLNNKSPIACPSERWVAAITVPRLSRWNQVPAGGLLASTFSSTVEPEVRSESRCERLQCRQKAMSLATLTSSLGITPLQRGHVGVTDRAEAILSSNCTPKLEFRINSIVLS